MSTKFEDAIAAAKAAHYESPEILQLIDLIVAQNERIKNLELYSLEGKKRMSETEKTVADHDASISSLAKSRDEHDANLKAINDKPAAEDKRIDDLETRVTTVEGAVGSKAYKRLDNKEGKVEPVPAPSIFAPPGQPPVAPVPPKV